MKLARVGGAHHALYGKNANGELIDIFAGKKRSKSNPNVSSDVPMKADGIDEELKLIPWREIKTSVSMARIRGHIGIVNIFFQVLVDQSLFDDQGAWWRLRQNSPRHVTEKKVA